MKYERAGATDSEALVRDTEATIASKKPTAYELSLMAGIFEYVAENKEAEQIRNRSREEWAELERRYVARAEFTLPDLVDNLLRRLEKGRISRQQVSEERRKYVACKHRFCLNYFVPRRSNQIYCDRKCQELEKQTYKDYIRSGTYLPAAAWKPQHAVEKERDYRKHERIFESGTLTLIADNKATEDGRSKRSIKERKNRKRDIDLAVKQGEKPVNIEE